ncbi:MAG: MoxR family ATPase [Lachnospiraceae bacterium]|nr:MoxR family ATPase [Ruminococcus sp.]MCM1274801.1 MoxR family ATPase [Lachnospiraceae bacterium]
MSERFQNQYLLADLAKEISKVIKGKDDALLIILTGLLARGHVLIEDVPGVGKTTLAMALGKASGLSFRRAQFTPDVMASDITGFTMFNKEENRFEYRAGLVMTNILLADEINRTSPKTQSALLEAMEEKRVTVDGEVHELPYPFMVIATQNSQGYVGTFPLPEAQLDRFMMKISMGYPTIDEEKQIMLDRLSGNPVNDIENVMTIDQIADCIDDIGEINFAESLCRYVAELAAATRNHPAVALGASPRASVAIMQASRAFAYLRGRDYVIPEDIVRLMIPVFEHRIVLRQETRVNKRSVRSVLEDVVSSVTPPVRRS